MKKIPEIQQISENYQIKVIDKYAYCENKVLGKGSFGSVQNYYFNYLNYIQRYEGYDAKENRFIAIKKIELDQIKQIDQTKMMNFIKSEIVNMQLIQHQNVVRLYVQIQIQFNFVAQDVKKSSRNLYLAVELCNGQGLDQRLVQGNNLSERDTIKIIKQILAGYKELLKKGVVHRDLKPANILFDNGTAKLTDFGFSKEVQNFIFYLFGIKIEKAIEDPQFKSRVGSPYFMSPQILQGQVYSPKTDIWSLGVMMFLMVYGQYPFQGQDHHCILENIKKAGLNFPQQPKISPELKQLISKMLVVKEKDRISWQISENQLIIIKREELFSYQIFQDADVLLKLQKISQKYQDNIQKEFKKNKYYFYINRVISNIYDCQQQFCNLSKFGFNETQIPQNMQFIEANEQSKKSQLKQMHTDFKDLDIDYQRNYLTKFFQELDELKKKQKFLNENSKYILSKRNKAIILIDSVLSFSSLVMKNKLQIENFLYIKSMFVILKRAKYKLAKLFHFVELLSHQEEAKSNNLMVDEINENLFKKNINKLKDDPDWKIFQNSSYTILLKFLLQFDMNAIEQIFDMYLTEVTNFLSTNLSLEKQTQMKKILLQKNYKELQPECSREIASKDYFKNIFNKYVQELSQKIISTIVPSLLSLESFEKNQKQFIAIAKIINVKDLKLLFQNQDISRFDYNKLYEKIEKFDFNQISKYIQQ